LTGRASPPSGSRGFSIVELLVGVAVGLLAILAVVQTLGVYENQRRTTTSGSDAQQSGLMGMFAIEEAIRNAGSGYASDPTLSCVNFFSYSDPDGPGPLTVSTTAFGSATPAQLINNAGGAGGPSSTDALEVRAASRITGSIPTWLTGNGMNAASRTLPVERAFDFAVNDLILVTSPVTNPTKNCALMRVSAVDLANRTLTVAHDTAQAPEYNPPDITYLNTNNWPGYGTRIGDPERFTKGSLVYRVGSTAGGGIETVRYCISNPAGTNRFELRIDSSATCNTTPCTAPGCQVLANDVVSIQAQYGLASGTRAVNAFRQTHNIVPFAILPRDVATWRNPNDTGITSQAELSKRVKAVRLAVIARSGKREGNIVTPVCTAIATTGPCACQNATANFGPCPWRDTAADPAPPVDLRSGAGDTEWQFYRYKVFETTVPLRNSIWPDLL
jgi:type IV pilus assembly protein PilW